MDKYEFSAKKDDFGAQLAEDFIIRDAIKCRPGFYNISEDFTDATVDSTTTTPFMVIISKMTPT